MVTRDVRVVDSAVWLSTISAGIGIWSNMALRYRITTRVAVSGQDHHGRDLAGSERLFVVAEDRQVAGDQADDVGLAATAYPISEPIEHLHCPSPEFSDSFEFIT